MNKPSGGCLPGPSERWAGYLLVTMLIPESLGMSILNILFITNWHLLLLQADNRDLQQPENASLVAGLLHKGLGRLGFGGVSTPVRSHISEYSSVLIFIVGGISPAEVREIRQELEEHKFGHKPTVLLGGTTWLTAADAARLVFD